MSKSYKHMVGGKPSALQKKCPASKPWNIVSSISGRLREPLKPWRIVEILEIRWNPTLDCDSDGRGYPA